MVRAQGATRAVPDEKAVLCLAMLAKVSTAHGASEAQRRAPGLPQRRIEVIVSEERCRRYCVLDPAAPRIQFFRIL